MLWVVMWVVMWVELWVMWWFLVCVFCACCLLCWQKKILGIYGRRGVGCMIMTGPANMILTNGSNEKSVGWWALTGFSKNFLTGQTFCDMSVTYHQHFQLNSFLSHPLIHSTCNGPPMIDFNNKHLFLEFEDILTTFSTKIFGFIFSCSDPYRMFQNKSKANKKRKN